MLLTHNFSEIICHPFSRFSEFGFNHTTEIPRNFCNYDYLITDSTTHIAVTFRAAKPLDDNFYSVDIGSRKYTIELQRFVKGRYETVSSAPFTINIPVWNSDQLVRIDLPFTADDLAGCLSFRICISYRDTISYTCPFNLYCPQVELKDFAVIDRAGITDSPFTYPKPLYVSSTTFEGTWISFTLYSEHYLNDFPSMGLRLLINDKWYDAETFQVHKANNSSDTDHGIGYFEYLWDLSDLERLNCPKGAVYAELTLFGEGIAGTIFEIGAEIAEPGAFSKSNDLAVYRTIDTFAAETVISGRKETKATAVPAVVTDPLEPLEKLVGLDDVKDKILTNARTMQFSQMRANSGFNTVTPPMHALFLGSPGTGKTTVAKIMGQMMHQIGALSKGHVVVRDRSTLIGQYYNSEAEKTLEALEEARGGILFIDEAYSLFQADDPRDPGKFVLETLLTELADPDKRDWMLILAGYTEPTMRLLEMNPGLRSRLPASNFYHFADFTAEQLMQIAEGYFAQHDFELTPEAAEKLRKRLLADYLGRKEDFGNARHVIYMIETEIIPAMARRICAKPNPTPDDLRIIHSADIPALSATTAATRPRLGFAA